MLQHIGAVSQSQEPAELELKVHGPLTRRPVPPGHDGTQVRNELTVLLKTGQLPLVLLAGVVGALGVES